MVTMAAASSTNSGAAAETAASQRSGKSRNALLAQKAQAQPSHTPQASTPRAARDPNQAPPAKKSNVAGATPIPTPYNRNWSDIGEEQQAYDASESDGMRDRNMDLREADGEGNPGDTSYEEAEMEAARQEAQRGRQYDVVEEGGRRAPRSLFRAQSSPGGAATPRGRGPERHAMWSPISGTSVRSRSREREDQDQDHD